MSAREIVWHDGEDALHARLGGALALELGRASTLSRHDRRTVCRIRLGERNRTAPTEESLIVKTHHTATGRHPIREALKRIVGRSPARREWQALARLRHASAPVPRPRAWGRLANGDEFIALECLPGKTLSERFEEATEPERDQLVEAIAHAVSRFHAVGFRHGDLHLDNLWWTGEEVMLLDLQRARRLRSRNDALWDLAQLDFSVARADWPPAMRAALRERLNPGPAFDAIRLQYLRDTVRGRGRRVLRVGRNWSFARVGTRTGLRDPSIDDATLERLLDSSRRDPDALVRRGGRGRLTEAEAGGRRVLVKSVTAGSVRRAVADRWRGSPARRAFLGAHRLRLLSDAVARPLAFLEDRGFGRTRESWLVLEKVGESDLDLFSPASPEIEQRVARALGHWLADLHAFGLGHRDLKAGNIRIALHEDRIRFFLIDLEDLRGPVRLSEEARLHALSQLNASLADEAFQLGSRAVALDAYLAGLPMKLDRATIAREVARRSLARAHRWRGVGCKFVE